MKCVYHAIITPTSGGYDVYFPDLPGCRTFGASLAEALEMAADAAEMWLWDAENKHEPIPAGTIPAGVRAPAFTNHIPIDTDRYRREHDTRAVKKTLSIPSWLNARAEQANAPYSQILQEGLKRYLGLEA